MRAHTRCSQADGHKPAFGPMGATKHLSMLEPKLLRNSFKFCQSVPSRLHRVNEEAKKEGGGRERKVGGGGWWNSASAE